MLKRALILVLTLSLCLPLMGAAEQTEPSQLFDSLLFTINDTVQSLVIYDGQALMLSRKALYGWRPGEEKAQEIAKIAPSYQDNWAEDEKQPTMSALIVNDGRLYGLNLQDGMLYKLTITDTAIQYKEALQLDWSDFIVQEDEYSYTNAPQYVLAHEGQLFVKASNWSSDRKQDLFSYDLKTGELSRYTPLHYQTLVPYKNGKLMAIYFDQNKTDPDTYQQMDGELRLFDPAADKDEAFDLKLPEDNQGKNRRLRLYYDQQGDRVYGINNEGVWRLSGKEEPVKVARLPMTGSWSSPGTTLGVLPLTPEKLIIGFGGNVFIRGIDEHQMPPAVSLTLPDFMGGQALTLALMAEDGIEAAPSQEGWMDEKDIATRFLLGEMPLDIIDLSSNYNDIQRMMQKGYLLDLTEDPTLQKIGENCYDNLKPIMYDKDRLYALPISVDTHFLSAYGPNFREIGKEIPGSYPQLLDFVRWWAQEGHQAHEGYALFDQPDAKNILKEIAYTQYKNSYFGQGKPLEFTMEGFGKLMREIDAIDFSGFDVRSEDLSEEDSGMVPGKPLFMSYMGYSMSDTGPDSTTEVKLSLDGKLQPYSLAYVSLLAIPATTKHPEEAKRLLSAFLKNMGPEERAAFDKTWTEPIENPNYEETLQDVQRTLKNYKRLYEEAEEGAKKRQYEQDIRHMEEQLANSEETWRYRVSEKGLSRHRELMDQLYVSDSLILVAEQALSADGSLFHMYLQGAISLEQFIQQANDKIRLMTLEAK